LDSNFLVWKIDGLVFIRVHPLCSCFYQSFQGHLLTFYSQYLEIGASAETSTLLGLACLGKVMGNQIQHLGGRIEIGF